MLLWNASHKRLVGPGAANFSRFELSAGGCAVQHVLRCPAGQAVGFAPRRGCRRWYVSMSVTAFAHDLFSCSPALLLTSTWVRERSGYVPARRCSRSCARTVPLSSGSRAAPPPRDEGRSRLPGRALPLSGALRCPSAELGARRGAGILGRRSVL